jgi:hypothetical protein
MTFRKFEEKVEDQSFKQNIYKEYDVLQNLNLKALSYITFVEEHK